MQEVNKSTQKLNWKTDFKTRNDQEEIDNDLIGELGNDL